jgi:cytochrome c-type biogenesis protein CcmH/NrfG
VWRAIRSLIVKANRASPNNPYPLWAYYRWHAKSGTPVTPTAIDGLRRALELAPQVVDLRFALAQQEFKDGHDAAARDALLPLLNDPHSAKLRAAAQAMLDGKGKLAMPSSDKDKQEPDPK